MTVDRDSTLDWMTRFAGEMAEHRQELVRLDTAIGDGDHGTNMNRGMQKALLAGQAEVDLPAFAAAWRKGMEGVQSRGKAQPGDKTMLDALGPAVDAFEQASDLDSGLSAAVSAAEQGMNATTPLVARKGRASYLGERSADHQDPGATSTFYLFKSAAEALAG